MQFFAGPCPIPISEKLLLVHCRPFNHEARYPRREASGKYRESSNVDECHISAILRMKVRRVVIVKKHLDHNAEETADFRHG